MGKKEKERKTRKELHARLEQAEYKITDLIECLHLLNDPPAEMDRDTLKQSIEERLRRQL